MTPRKILLLTTNLAQGGAEVVVMQLALALRSSGCDVHVVSMLEPTALVEELEAGGAPVVSLNMKPRRLNLGGVLHFLRLLRRYRPHLIHAHMYHAAILARMARLLVGVPVICTIHSEIEGSDYTGSARFRELIYRMTGAACNRITAVSERTRQRFVLGKVVSSHRIEVIENGVDPERFRPRPEQRLRTRAAMGWNGSFVWLAVGRLELAKDYANLIQAFRKAHQQAPTSSLAIVGAGRLRGPIESQIRDAGLCSSVSLLGARTDVPDLMNACDALVVSSAWEGGPLVLLEAGAVGRPVVSTEVGFASQAVIPGRTGLLVPPRDTCSLAQAMAALMALDSAKLEEMGQEARRHIMERFSLGTKHNAYQRLYQEVLAADR